MTNTAMTKSENAGTDNSSAKPRSGIAIPDNAEIGLDYPKSTDPLTYRNPSMGAKESAANTNDSKLKGDPHKQPDFYYKKTQTKDKHGNVSYEDEKLPLPPAVYPRKLSCESAFADTEVIVPKTIHEYIDSYKKSEEKSARETLTMCRIVYEAEKSLNSAEFSDFCSKIGYKDYSSVIRKFIVIGKIQPRLIQHAEMLPASWTSLYLLTQIPAQHFENFIHMNRSLKDMSVSSVKELVQETRDLNNIGSVVKPTTMTQDEMQGKLLRSSVMAKVYFTQVPDDLDWYAFEKAMLEIQSNLPVRILFDAKAKEIFYKRKSVRYEKAKEEQSPEIFKPGTWDLGRAVDAVKTKALIESEDIEVIESGEQERN